MQPALYAVILVKEQEKTHYSCSAVEKKANCATVLFLFHLKLNWNLLKYQWLIYNSGYIDGTQLNISVLCIFFKTEIETFWIEKTWLLIGKANKWIANHNKYLKIWAQYNVKHGYNTSSHD